MRPSPILVTLLFVGSLSAQTTSAPANPPNKLAFVLPALYEQAIQESPSILQSAIRSAIQPNSVSLNASAGVQLSNLPVPSPAANYMYLYDESSNTRTRVLLSLGPILSERWQTIGKGNFSLTVTHQTFSFDRLDDLNLRGFQASYSLPFAGAELGVDASVSLLLTQTAAHFTWGASDRVDVSYSFPMVTSSLSLRANAVIAVGGQNVTLPSRFLGASAAGLGDGTIRLKARLIGHSRSLPDGSSTASAGVAFATDVRLPIGDELNYHGAGSYGVRPTIIASVPLGRFTPHLNAGYQWNGDSYLGSQYATRKGKLPGIWSYALGFDAGMSKRVTLSGEILDNIVVSGQRAFLLPPSTTGTGRPVISFTDKTRQEVSGAIGLKALLSHNLFFNINTLFRLNNAGLRARVVPLVGLSYLFEN